MSDDETRSDRLGRPPPDDETPPPPPAFEWGVAWDQVGRAGADRAMIIGLSMISEQLGYMIDRMNDDG